MTITDAMVLRLQRILNGKLKEIGSGKWVGEPMARGILEEVVMATKTVVTDEMVERAKHAAFAADCAGRQNGSMREALEAAINPPEEPSIVVTREMLEAAHDALDKGMVGRSYVVDEARIKLYRAMRKLEPSVIAAIRAQITEPTPHEHEWKLLGAGGGGGSVNGFRESITDFRCACGAKKYVRLCTPA